MIIGIDPGVNGAVAVLSYAGKFAGVYDIPTVLANKSSKRQMVSPAGLINLMDDILWDDHNPVAITEIVNAMPGQGVSSMFALGKSCGILLGVLGALRIPTHLISPAKWKKFYGLGRDKEQSRELALRLWPNAPLNLKHHHNRAESLLLARYYAETSQAVRSVRPRLTK